MIKVLYSVWELKLKSDNDDNGKKECNHKISQKNHREGNYPFSSFFKEFIEITDDKQNIGLTLSQLWNSYKKNEIYYEKDVKMKDVREYLENVKKLECFSQKRIDGHKYTNLFGKLKWINKEH